MEPHKRYILFALCPDSPVGAFGDMRGDFDTLEEAIEKANTIYVEIVFVYDRLTGLFVWDKDP